MLKKKKVIIADASQAYLSYLGSILQKMGFTAVLAHSGAELVRIIERAPPDMILLDIAIAQRNEGETLRLLSANGTASSMPVIITTSASSSRAIGICRELGYSAYITKPIFISDLHDMLQNHIYAPLGLEYKRASLRALYNDHVTVISQGRTIELRAESLSEGGIFLLMDAPLSVGTELEIKMSMEDGTVLSLAGTIVYNNKFRSEKNQVAKGIAVEFSEGDPMKLKLISDFIQGLLTIPFNIPESHTHCKPKAA